MDILWRRAPRDLELARSEVHVWRAGLDRGAAELESLRRCLSDDERERACRQPDAKSRGRFIAARGSLRLILGRYLRREPSAIRLRYGPDGKPALGSDRGSIRFNLSHSDGLALFGFSRVGRVGVDLERMSARLDVEAIAARFFAPAERGALAKSADARRDRFYALWTCKEAYAKAVGKGLALALDGVEIGFGPSASEVRLIRPEDPAEPPRWTIRTLAVGGGFKGALALEGRAALERYWNLDQ